MDVHDGTFVKPTVGKDLRTSVKGGRSTMQVIPGPTRRGERLLKLSYFRWVLRVFANATGVYLTSDAYSLVYWIHLSRVVKSPGINCVRFV